jgi:hypothetical protein
MTLPLNLPDQRADATDLDATPPFSGGSDISRDERRDLAPLGADLLRRARESQPALEAAWDALLEKWGVRGEPVGIQRLRAMIGDECGSKPEDNMFSRELITLREEHRP